MSKKFGEWKVDVDKTKNMPDSFIFFREGIKIRIWADGHFEISTLEG